MKVSGASTLLSLPVRAEDAPNVFFKVAIPHGNRLLEAETEVVVLRTLQVEVKLPAESGPGEEVEVEVFEPIGADWEILSSSHRATKLDAHTFKFTVKIPPRGEETITYRVRVRWC